MGEFICVCARYACEIKAVEVPMCNMAQRGLRHPISKWVGNGCRRTIQDGWLWEASALSKAGRKGEGMHFWGGFWLVPCDA